MKTKFYLWNLLLAVMLCLSSANAQVLTDYVVNFTYGNTYVPISASTGGPITSVYSSAGYTYYSNTTASIPDFDYKLEGVTWNSFLIYGNGMVTKGSAPSGGSCYYGTYYYSAIPFTYNRPAIYCGYHAFRTDANSSIGWQVQGVKPNRTLVIQYKEVMPYYTVTTYLPTVRMNFQIRIQETSNIVEFVFGTNNLPSINPSAMPNSNSYVYSFSYGMTSCDAGKYISVYADEGGQNFVAHKHPAPSPGSYKDSTAIRKPSQASKIVAGLKMSFLPYPMVSNTFPKDGDILLRNKVYSTLTNDQPYMDVTRVSVHPDVQLKYKISGPVGYPDYKVIYQAMSSPALPNDTLFAPVPQPVGTPARVYMPAAKGIASTPQGGLDLMSAVNSLIPGDYVLESEMFIPSANFKQVLAPQTIRFASEDDIAALGFTKPLAAPSKYAYVTGVALPVSASIKNAGALPIKDFTVYAKIYTTTNNQLVYSDSSVVRLTNLTKLKFNEVYSLDFKNFNPSGVADYKMVLSVKADSTVDQYTVNNIFPAAGKPDYILRVVDQNEAAATAIKFTQVQGYVGRPLYPQATIKNNGVADISDLPVNMVIKQNGLVVYNETQNIQNVPAAGSYENTVQFTKEFIPTSAGIYEFTATIALPGDPIVSNDVVTAQYVVADALNGNYTIGVNGTYKSIRDAVSALFLRGVRGPVTFELLDAEYNEGDAVSQPTLPALDFRSKIIGVNSVNTVTFKPTANLGVTKGAINIKLKSGIGKGIVFGQSLAPTVSTAPMNNVYPSAYAKYSNSEGYIIFDGGIKQAIKLSLESTVPFRAPVYMGPGSKNISILNCVIANGQSDDGIVQTLPLTTYNASQVRFDFEDDWNGTRGFTSGIVIRNKAPMDDLRNSIVNTFNLDTIPASNNTIENCDISGYGYGIVSIGIGPLYNVTESAFLKYYNNANKFNKNYFHQIGRSAIFVGNEENTDITNNRIDYVLGVAGLNSAGIIAGGEQRGLWSGYNNLGLNISANEISHVYSTSQVEGIVVEQCGYDLPLPNGVITRIPSASESSRIINNIVWGLNPNMDATINRYGIRLQTERKTTLTNAFDRLTTGKLNGYFTRNDKIINNTVIMDADLSANTTGNVAALLALNVNGLILKNNAFVVSENEVDASSKLLTCVLLTGKDFKNGVITSDRNAFELAANVTPYRYIRMNDNSTVTQIGYNNEFKNLEQWANLTKNDLNSYVGSFKNQFILTSINPYKLRVNASPAPTNSILNNRGESVSGVLFDIDGNTRGAANQRFDIGACEFNGIFYTNDLEVVRMTTPAAYRNGQGDFTDAEYIMTTSPIDVKTLVRNNGSLNLTGSDITVKIYREDATGVFPTTPTLTRTVKVPVASTENVEVSFGLDNSDGKGVVFAPQSYYQISGFTCPDRFKAMQTNVTPRYKITVEVPNDEQMNNNTLPYEKIVRFFIKRSAMNLLVSSENASVTLPAITLNPNDSLKNVISGKLNSDSLIAAFNRLGWKQAVSENAFDFDVLDRTNWDTLSVDYTIYRHLFWTDGQNSKLTDRQVRNIKDFYNSAIPSVKKSLIFSSEELVRNTTNPAHVQFVKDVFSAQNYSTGTYTNTSGNKLVGLTVSRTITFDILNSGYNSNEAPAGAWLSIVQNANATPMAAFCYKSVDTIASNLKMASIMSNSTTMNVLYLGLDWRHFSNTSSMLRGIVDYIESNGGRIVPVELISFEAQPVHNRVELFWSTASEINSSKFEVERKSFNKVSDFEKIAELNAKGNTTSITNYGPIVDRNVNAGLTYVYRLKAIDVDGSFTYGEEKTVTLSGSDATSISEVTPNPVSGISSFNVTSANDNFATIKLMDLSGREIAVIFEGNLKSGANTFNVDASSLASGSYLINFVSGSTNLVKSIQVVK